MDPHRQRKRSNTTSTSFAPFSWRRQRPDVPQPQPILPLEDLIQALTPPAVPSLAHARALATALASHTPLPRPHVLNSILTSLCAPESPAALQSSGYDILSAYWENNEAPPLATSDRLAHFSLFLGANSASWSNELWEPRFKALRALTKWGSEVMGMESQFIDLLKSWLRDAFGGLFTGTDPAEQVERERSIGVLSSFLSGMIGNPDVSARLQDHELSGILQLHEDLVNRSIDVPLNLFPNFMSPPLSPPTTDALLPSNTSGRAHRRHPSSLSIAPVPRPVTPPKHPADTAVWLYLNFLSDRLKFMVPDMLSSILPLLFRVLAFYASPLPRLTVVARLRSSSRPEENVTETLDSIFSGPYSTKCINILKRHLYPPTSISSQKSLRTFIQISIGAHRTLRNYIRKGLCTRLARAYISRESLLGYSHSGAPGHLNVERELMERAWPKDDVSGWDAGRLGLALHKSVKAWITYEFMWEGDFSAAREKFLDEAAGILKDVLQELDSRENNNVLEDAEACAVGETLHQLAMYIHPLRNADNSPFIIPLVEPMDAPTPFLRTLCYILSRDHLTYLNPLLSTTLLSLAGHLTDTDTAKLPVAMSEQRELSPTSPDWLKNWEQLLLGTPPLLHATRPLTRAAIINALDAVYNSVKDMPQYRKPLANLVWESCTRLVADSEGEEPDNSGVLWRILGDEIVQRSVEGDDPGELIDRSIALLKTVAEGERPNDTDAVSVAASDAQSPSVSSSVLTSAAVSPIFSRTPIEVQSRDRDTSLPSVMSLLSSLATGSSSRSQSMQPQTHDDSPTTSRFAPQFSVLSLARDVSAAVALVYVFTQLSFTPHALSENNIALCIRVYSTLLNLLGQSRSERTRLTILQFMTRLRADRDHRLYYVVAAYDPDAHVSSLASIISRVWDPSSSRRPRYERANDEAPVDDSESRNARTRTPQTRESRQTSTTRGGRPSLSAASRSQSRSANTLIPNHPPKPREPMWRVPEALPFVGTEVNTPSETLISYDPAGLENRFVLPISDYLDAIVFILEHERSWEILSYVLCHLPVQLANKHLFCGPKACKAIVRMMTTLCNGLLNSSLASEVEHWPPGIKTRDAQGLAYHTLSVLISYQRYSDVQLKHVFVEVFLSGLDGQPPTIKCCLHALSLAAFELRTSMTKYLSMILEKLSRIMSNPDMAVHIINFLSIVGSIHSLHANFTENDYKMVFAVALQYLQHHSEPGSSPISSWALSQHVRIMSFYTVYVWFLSVRLSDRSRHIRFITRQLLIANEGKPEVDEQTEVCLDWLARYTYASADPRPANSLLSDIVMNSTPSESSSELPLIEKAWIAGNSIIAIRTLTRLGWIEVITRRPSGFTKFLCRVENAPMVGAGDVHPDLMSGPAFLLMERDPVSPHAPSADLEIPRQLQENVREIFATTSDADPIPPRPDPVTGYVWSGSAPSQRRKEVAVDPAYFLLQLSAYPGLVSAPQLQRIEDTSGLPALFRTLDRIPVIDTHKVGIMYVAPSQTHELEILRNTHGSPAYTRFLEGIGRLINLRGQLDVYAGGLNPDEDGEYAYAWWDDIGQILYHTATMMPSHPGDEYLVNKKRHIGNDFVRIVWNDSGVPYNFDTLATQFQFVNIVIEPHSLGTIAAFSNNIHENEYFKVTVQRAPGMTEFSPVGEFKLISAENLPLLVRQLCLLSDWFASIFQRTQCDTERVEMTTNWRARLQAIERFRKQLPAVEVHIVKDIMDQEAYRDFTTTF